MENVTYINDNLDFEHPFTVQQYSLQNILSKLN